MQKGDAFDLATLTCSALIGSGFDAYVVHGRVSPYVALNDYSQQPCPLCDSGTNNAGAAADEHKPSGPSLKEKVCEEQDTGIMSTGASELPSKPGVPIPAEGDKGMTSIDSELLPDSAPAVCNPADNDISSAADGVPAAARGSASTQEHLAGGDLAIRECGNVPSFNHQRDQEPSTSLNAINASYVHAWILVKANRKVECY